MESYLGQMCSLMQECDALLPFSATKTDHESQRDKLFMVLTLLGLKPKFKPIRHQILTGSTIPTMKDTYKRLLNMASSSSLAAILISPSPETSALVSQISGGTQGRFSGRARPQCNFCKKKEHEEDKCWKKHGRPSTPLASQGSST